MSDRQIHAVILAGGSGSRLWPLSRRHLPKQFLSLDGDESLLQTTINRLSPVIKAENVLIVTQEAHAKGEAYHALLPYRTLFEPVGRNTAPAIALAAAWLMVDGTDPVMVVLPADYIIKDAVRFRNHLNIAIQAAENGKLITFGIQPNRPDTGFGYIKIKGLGTHGRGQSEKAASGSTQSSVLDHQSGILEVERFTEKPDIATAEQFLKQGDYYWNSGMFVWRASVILAEIRQHLPAVHQVIQTIIAESRAGMPFQQAVEKHFSAMPSISIDYGVLEKSDRVSLIPCDIYLLEQPEEKLQLLFGDEQPSLVNVGCGEDMTIRELAELVGGVVGFTGELTFDTSKPDGTMRKLMDVSKLKRMGWQATTSLQDGVTNAYESYQSKGVA